jgi:hypothetical protein
MDTKKQFRQLLEDAVKETGVDIEESLDSLALFMSERALHLSTIVAEPGFPQAVRAERNRVALHAGLSVAHDADKADHRMLGIVQGALALAAGALV